MNVMIRGFVRRRVLRDLMADHNVPRLKARTMLDQVPDKDIDYFCTEQGLTLASKSRAAGPVLDWLYEHREQIAQVILLIIKVLMTAAAAAAAAAPKPKGKKKP